MLALAPPLHDHTSSHSAPVSASKTPAVRSKPVARRAPSSTALGSSASSSSSSSSLMPTSSSASSSNPVVQAGVSRPNPQASLSRTEIPSVPRHEASQSSASASKPLESQVIQQPVLNHMPPLLSSSTVGDFAVDIHSYPTPDLLRLLASLLNQIAAANDALSTPSSSDSHPSPQSSPTADHPPIWQSLFTASRASLSTPTSPLTFHARNIPSISLEAYLLRILRYCPTTNEVFLSLLVYFDRMSKLAQEATSSRFVIDSYNVHRLVIAGVTVASKFFSDVFYTNSRYAKVGGLPQAELNQLELQFLLLNDFRLAIPTDEMQRYAEQLIRFSQGSSEHEIWSVPPVVSSETGPSRPMQSMGAFDAFGGVISSDAASYSGAHVPRNTTPRRSVASVTAAALPDEQSERDQEGSVYYETDTDAGTDDEPTIRPTHSCASSDTQSLFSNDASEEADDIGDDSETNPDRHTINLQHPLQHGWNTAPSGDGHTVTSP
ncbi:hypothetical protein M0805_005382 [Coniferiporia weirii]|nr:hypothetical protein M0805_005382 [Coniferiporia weirii]